MLDIVCLPSTFGVARGSENDVSWRKLNTYVKSNLAALRKHRTLSSTMLKSLYIFIPGPSLFMSFFMPILPMPPLIPFIAFCMA